VSLPLKLAVLFAIALALFNGQCIANCMAFPCQSQDNSSLPPCHQHQNHNQQPKACAQPAAANNATAPVEPLLFLAVQPCSPISFAIHRLQAREHHSPPDSPPPVPLTLRI
jgi:hypothetical protein